MVGWFWRRRRRERSNEEGRESSRGGKPHGFRYKAREGSLTASATEKKEVLGLLDEGDAQLLGDVGDFDAVIDEARFAAAGESAEGVFR